MMAGIGLGSYKNSYSRFGASPIVRRSLVGMVS